MLFLYSIIYFYSKRLRVWLRGNVSLNVGQSSLIGSGQIMKHLNPSMDTKSEFAVLPALSGMSVQV